MTAASAFDRATALEAPPVLPRTIDDRAITDLVCAPLMRPAGTGWWIAFLIASAGTLATLYGVYTLFSAGIGIFGNNTSVVWGFPIANYVWWIGIGNAGTLISSLLLLTRQSWRTSISRFAEAMTLFAVSIAGLFPIFHLGRPLYFYWLAPYPDTMQVWPQWRSALIWDFWAITSYLLFSIIFWYVGVLPDLGTARDRSRGAWRKVYGVFALGWRGSARHWRHYRRLQITLAALATPLVCSVHSIVGLDFAASLMPGWREPIFPPYFVVGAMYSGFAMVVLITIAISRGLGLQALITERHFDAMAKIMLMAAIVMGLSYASEWFAAWIGGDASDRDLVAFEFTGAYWPEYAGMLFCNVLAPQVLWFPRAQSEPCRPYRRLDRDSRRHVARAHPDHLEHAVAQFPAQHGPGVLPDLLGLALPVRTAVLFRLDVPALLPARAGRADARGARASPPGGVGVSEKAPLIVAEFGNPDALVHAARGARDQGFKPADALTPCPVAEIDEALGLETSPIRWPMLVAAIAVAALAYGLEFWSAVYAYPIDSGGRPLQQLACLSPRAVRGRGPRGGDRRLCRVACAVRSAATPSSRVRMGPDRARVRRPLFPTDRGAEGIGRDAASPIPPA